MSAIETESPKTKRRQNKKQSHSSNESKVSKSSSEGAETNDSKSNHDKRKSVSKSRAMSIQAKKKRSRNKSNHTAGALQAKTERAQAGGVSLSTNTVKAVSLNFHSNRADSYKKKAIINSVSKKLHKLCKTLKSFPDSPKNLSSKKVKQKKQSTLTRRTSNNKTITLGNFFPISYKKSSSKKKLQKNPEKQQSDTLYITASEKIPTLATSATASNQKQSATIPKNIVKAFLQHIKANLKSQPKMKAKFPQIFQTSQNSQILVPQPKPKTTQKIQVPAMPVSKAA